MITLHGHPSSSNSRKVHWALEELGVPYEYRTIDLMARAQKHPDYVALNPNGRVPTVTDDEFTLYESNAILWYLGDKFGGGKLVPDHLHQRALVDQWIFWQASDLAPAVSKPYRMKLYQALGQPFDAAEHATACEAAKVPLAILDAHLAKRAFVVGEQLSIADIALAESVGVCEQVGISLEPFANVRAWFSPLTARPAHQKTRPPQR